MAGQVERRVPEGLLHLLFHFIPRPSLTSSSLISSMRRDPGLVLLLRVPLYLRLTAQPLLSVCLPQVLDFVAQRLNPVTNFFQSRPCALLLHDQNISSTSPIRVPFFFLPSRDAFTAKIEEARR